VSRERLVIRNRTEFDAFWNSGVEAEEVQSRAVLRSSGEGDDEPTTNPTRAEDAPSLGNPPVTAQVWWRYASERSDSAIDLLIDPGVSEAGQTTTPLGLAATANLIQNHVIDGNVSLESTGLAVGFGFVAIELTYQEMVTRLLPLTSWRGLVASARQSSQEQRRIAMRSFRRLEGGQPSLARLGWFLHLLAICGDPGGLPTEITYGVKSRALTTVRVLLTSLRTLNAGSSIGRVTLNRPVTASVQRSQQTVKVDATRSLFDVRCDSIRWAVVDSGIDARHDWFRLSRPDGRPWADPFENDGKVFNYTRIERAYNFARQRASGAISSRDRRGESIAVAELSGDIPVALALGERFYEPPENGHGTHVAGIIGGAGGLCPDIKLYDYRVLDENGRGNEFSVVAALRQILDLTQRASYADPTGRNRDLPIHGVNLSVALDADVTSDACGWSVVCRVCDELVRAGVVVVVAAGNTGFEDRTGAMLSTGQDYRTVSITDPGNTDRVITVGSTDADRPREYGVSFFSARGPTADGRAKPDLVAPGNAITSSYGYRRADDDRRNVAATLSGTSMSAAHVSGCAAVLIARHRELIGKPEDVKRILMNTATDLHRDRSFQGAGLVDALRAVQSV
jgi:Subtilase family